MTRPAVTDRQSPARSHHPARAFVTTLAYALGIYLIGRALVEPFVINLSDPVTYRADWGGPHLAGVLAVHMLPGLISAAAIVWHQVHRLRNRG